MRISDWSSDVCSSDLHDAVLRRVVEAPHLRAATAARAAVQQHHLLAPGVAALLVMERVAVVDFELAGVEGFDLGIERAHAGNPWKKRRPSLAVGPACAFHDCLWETRLPAPAQRHAIALLEVALGGHVGEARGLEQRANRRALLPAVLDQQDRKSPRLNS